MSTAPKPQSYETHRARLPALFVASGAVIAIDVCRRAWLAFHERDLGVDHWGVHLWYVVLLSAVLAVWYSNRRNAQIVQDRVIRIEMRVRLERVLGASRRLDIDRLTLKQLIALRFASDAEMPALVEEVLAGKISTPDEIKRRIRDWQADWLRV